MKESIWSALGERFPLNERLCAALIGIAAGGLVALVLCGGMKRIAEVNERLVPFMAVFYTAGALVILFAHADRILPALLCIFREAFSF